MAFWGKVLKKKEKESAAAPARKFAAPETKEIVSVSADRQKKVIAGVLRAAHITEKSAAGALRREYTFRIASGVNKRQVAEAVRAKYGVHVDAVRVLNLPAKERRRGRIIGWKPGFKKAMVKIAEGEVIEAQ